MDRRDGDWNFGSGGIRGNGRGRSAAMCRIGESRTKTAGRDVSNRRGSIKPAISRESHCQADFGGWRPGVGQRVQRSSRDSTERIFFRFMVRQAHRHSVSTFPDPRDEIDADPELPSTTRTVSRRSENNARIEPSSQESPSAGPLAHGHRRKRRGGCSARDRQRPSAALLISRMKSGCPT